MATATITGESKHPLSEEELGKMHDYWRAANYLSVGQIYLYANPLLLDWLPSPEFRSPTTNRARSK